MKPQYREVLAGDAELPMTGETSCAGKPSESGLHLKVPLK